MSLLLGCRLNTARLPAIWPLLIVAGLLSVPAECARIGHPHSLYQSVSAEPAASTGHAGDTPHSAAAHDHAGSGSLPAWASPEGIIAPLIELPAVVSQPHPTYPDPGIAAPAAPRSPSSGDLPVVEPAAPAAMAAFGTTLALIAALAWLLLPGLPRATGVVAPLSGLLARALDPPPPRTVLLAR